MDESTHKVKPTEIGYNPAVDAPRTVFLELTSHCNMHCEFCPSDILRREKGTLAASVADRFLDQLHALDMRPPILLNVLGEPLLNKAVFPLLDRLERDGHLVTLITNMTLLTDPQVRRELLRHSNLTLALSLQTATSEAYRMRGYPRMPFDEFFGLVFEVIEDKFRLASGTRLEIHIASSYVVAHDPTIQSDIPLRLWPNFADEKAERRWIRKTLRRLEAFGRRMRRTYPEAYAGEKSRIESLYKDQIGTKIAVSRKALPADFHRLKDEVFWGYMVMPHTLLVFKSFELWTRDEAFLRRALPPGTVFYVEENPGPWACPMTESFGLLADGTYVLCCLDYEGEMHLGGIASTPIADFLGGERRAALRADAMIEPVCRRCKGNLFVFDAAPLLGTEQKVDKLGRGWWPHESALHGRGGSWTKGEAWAYALARIPAKALRLRFLSTFPDDTAFKLEIRTYDEQAIAFGLGPVFEFRGRKGLAVEFRAAFDFQPGRLYRIDLLSPTFAPGVGDPRRLGLAVYEISLLA
ncbi:MAG: radical SAM protein [Candidatus Aminicenantes bacterium]|nr:radical SAM protein [Candidatus Aminicenantes bacterium]